MGDGPKKLSVIFYRTPRGAEPVRDWLNDLPQEHRRTLGHDIGNVEYGWPVGMPLCRSLGGGLWEVRTNLPSHRTARVIFHRSGPHGAAAWFREADAENAAA
jgi:phage-related protein